MAGASIKIGASSSEFQKQMKEVTSQLKLVSSECGVASEKAKLFGTAQDKLAATNKELTAKMQAQNQMIQLYKDRIIGINGEIDKQKSKQSELTTKIDDANKKYKESVEQTGKNSEESKKLKQELEGLKEEYAKNERAIEGSNKKLIDATTKMNNTEKAMLQNQRALEDINKEIQNSKIDKLAEGFEKTGDMATNAGKKMSIVSAGIVGVGTAGVAAFKEVDSGMDNVVKATGATGEAAKALEKNYKNLASNINEDFGSIGSALGEANTRFGYTGEALEDCTEKFIQFAKINNTDATSSIKLVSRAMGDAGIESDKYGEVLDYLTSAAQKSGIGVDKLAESLTKYGAPMRALGFDTKESIAIFSQWELAGVNTEIAFSGMKAAIGNWGKEGKDARVEFKKTLDEIASCPDIAIATSKSIEVFGQKAGPDLADAIQGGRFEYSEFLNALEESQGIVTDTFNQVQDGTDKAAIAMNATKVAGAELGEAVLVSVSPILERLTEVIRGLTSWFTELSSEQQQNIVKIGGLVAAIGPALIILGSFSKGISNIITGYKDMRDFGSKAVSTVKDFGSKAMDGAKAAGNFALNLGKTALEFGKNAVQAGISAVQFVAHKVATIASTVATNAMSVAQAALNFVMSLNPITLIIIGIAALIATIVLLWNKCEWFRNLCIGMFEAIKSGWDSSIQFLKNKFEEFVNNWNTSIENIKNTWNNICSTVKGKWDSIVGSIKEKWNEFLGKFSEIGSSIKSKWQELTSGIVSKWNEIVGNIKSAWSGIIAPFQNVVNSIKNIWAGIKSMFKLPHFSITGKFSLVPPSIPKVSVDWYYNGGIFKNPTVLGGIGVGDAFNGQGSNAEAVIPLDSMYRNIDNIISNRLSEKDTNNGVTIAIENFINNSEKDIEQLCKELEFYRRRISY